MDEPAPRDDGVGVRTLRVGSLPLFVVRVGEDPAQRQLLAAIGAAGVGRIDGLLGVDLPRGAQVGVVVGGDEVRLVDTHDAVLLRAERTGLDRDWIAAARRLRGTMFVVVDDSVDMRAEPAGLLAALDVAARSGTVSGAIVGVAEERPSLPMMFG